jgi:hypothetical protein
MIGAIATGLTFLRNFRLPSLILAGLGLALGASGAWYIARSSYAASIADLRGQIAAAKLAHAEEQARTAASAVEAMVHAREMLAAAEDGLRARGDAAIAVYTAAGAAMTQSLARLDRSIRGMRNDPTFACRDLPLPAQYLDGMRRPGAAGDRGAAVPPLDVRAAPDGDPAP